MEWTVLLLTIASVILMQATGVSALTSNSDIIGIAVAGCASFVLLSLVIGILIASCNWNSWFRNWMRQQGKIRMPKAYFKKKEDSKKRLISGSPKVNTHQVNGNLRRPIVDRDVPVTRQNTPRIWNTQTPNGNHAPSAKSTSFILTNRDLDSNYSNHLVQGWRQEIPGVTNRIYEEKDATVELGDEVDDEYKIETEVVDNEVLDVGPFKHDHSKEVPVKGDVYSEPYIYSTVDRTKRSATSLGNSTKPARDSRNSAEVVTKSMEDGYYIAGGSKVNKFDEGLLYM